MYLEHSGSEGLRTAAGAKQGKAPGEWALLGVGLLATVVVTVYVTRLARKALREQTRIGETPTAGEQEIEPDERADAGAKSWPWGPTALAMVAVLMLAVAAGATEHLDMELLDYVPVYRSLAGTGGGWAFARWM